MRRFGVGVVRENEVVREGLSSKSRIALALVSEVKEETSKVNIKYDLWLESI